MSSNLQPSTFKLQPSSFNLQASSFTVRNSVLPSLRHQRYQHRHPHQHLRTYSERDLTLGMVKYCYPFAGTSTLREAASATWLEPYPNLNLSGLQLPEASAGFEEY